jgi:hypothetical protein
MNAYARKKRSALQNGTSFALVVDPIRDRDEREILGK